MSEPVGELTKRQLRRARKIAARNGNTLGMGLAVNGHHGWPESWRHGCGTYNLFVNLETETVDCATCGATDLARVPTGMNLDA